jgi:hypothetical protein
MTNPITITNINPQLQDLQDLIGIWQMEMTNVSSFPDSSTIIKGEATIDWFEGGDFVILRQGVKEIEPWATWFIGRDKDSKNYTVLYLDDTQSSRVYEMSLENRVWKIWRKTPEFIQRFTGEISQDSSHITGYWENSVDATTWTHDFDLTYTKMQKIIVAELEAAYNS